MKLHEFPLLHERYLEEQLPNGLTIRVVPRAGFAKKFAVLAVNYGSIDTTFTHRGETFRSPDGVAHYLEHKMFDLPEGSASTRFSACGATDNAFTSYTTTAYFFDCVDQFEENLETLLHMVSTGYFTQQSVEKERGIIEQEILMYEDSASSVVIEQLFAAMYANHPLRVSISGTVESISEITAETLQLCYDAFYTPRNMMLCVVGEVDAEQIASIARRVLPQTMQEPAVPDYGQEEQLCPHTSHVERCMEISMPTFQLGFACAAPKTGEQALRREIIAELAAEVLMGESSVLYNQLYAEGLIDSSFGSGYECVKGVSMLTAGGDSDAPELVLSRIVAEAERLCREGIEPGLFPRLKRAALGSRIRELDSFEGIAFRLCGYFFEGVEYYEFPDVFETVDETQVLDFLAEVVREERAAISIIRPKGKEEEA